VPVSDFKDEDLPESWDWRNVNGYDFLSPLRDQGSCGSCYTISFITSVESRLRIRHGIGKQVSA
jgi:C1A family cysteine protease